MASSFSLSKMYSPVAGSVKYTPAEVIIAGEIIEHLDDSGSFLDGLHSLVEPGGRLVITTPNSSGLLNAGAAAQAGYEVNHPDHVTLYSCFTLTNLLERHGLAAKLLQVVNRHLQDNRLLLRTGTIVDATIIDAPSSTKNSSGTRDPEMHQTKKGNQWFFGMKAHIDVDRDSGLVHTVVSTAANAADVTQTGKLLHGKEKTVYADAGYTGADKREELKDRKIYWNIAERRSRIKALPEGELKDVSEFIEHLVAKVRARVEHPFRVIKRQFGYTKVRYRGLAKNGAQVATLFALSNLWMARKRLLAIAGKVRPQNGKKAVVQVIPA